MAYQLPNFNVVVGIQHAVAAGEWADPVFTVGQLKGINKYVAAQGVPGPLGGSAQLLLKLPALTDIRDAGNFLYTDRVVLDGFDRPLVVVLVWDVAFGFPNEYRCAALLRSDPDEAGFVIKLPGQGDTPDRS